MKHKQDSTLLASQQELAVVDSTLEAVKTQYEQMKKMFKSFSGSGGSRRLKSLFGFGR